MPHLMQQHVYEEPDVAKFSIPSCFATAWYSTASPNTKPAMTAGFHPGGCTDGRDTGLVPGHTLLL